MSIATISILGVIIETENDPRGLTNDDDCHTPVPYEH